MLTVYDLESRTISEMLLLAANPEGLEERLIPEGKNFFDELSFEESDIFNNLIREKLVNTINQRRTILNIINETVFDDASHYVAASCVNEEQLQDYITENAWNKAYREIKGMETRLLSEKEREESTLIDRVKRYKDPTKLLSFKKTARNTDIAVDLYEYENWGRNLPVIVQLSEKTASSVANKWGEKLVHHYLSFAGGSPLPVDAVANEIRDYVRAMIVTMYGNEESGPFRNPNNRNTSSQDRIIQTLLSDKRIKIVNVKDIYNSNRPVRWWSAYVKLSDAVIEDDSKKADKNRRIIRYPSSYSGRETTSLMLIDARNYFAYFFGEAAHMRAKMKHKHGIHKDNIDLRGSGLEEVKINAEKVIKSIYENATALNPAK